MQLYNRNFKTFVKLSLKISAYHIMAKSDKYFGMQPSRIGRLRGKIKPSPKTNSGYISYSFLKVSGTWLTIIIIFTSRREPFITLGERIAVGIKDTRVHVGLIVLLSQPVTSHFKDDDFIFFTFYFFKQVMPLGP